MWRQRLKVHLSTNEDCVAVVGDRLYGVAQDAGKSRLSQMQALDTATGQPCVLAKLRWPPHAIAGIPGHLVVTNLWGDDKDTPGLYRMDPDGGAQEPVVWKGVQAMRRSGDLLLLGFRGDGSPRRTLEMRRLPSLELLWSEPGGGPGGPPPIALDGDTAFHLDPEDPYVPVARDAATGALRWRGEPMPSGGRAPSSRIWTAGPYLFLRSWPGFHFYRRADGQRIGDVDDGEGALEHEGDLYIDGSGYVARARAGSADPA